ncbi:PHP domain-containing protein [[Clostridium] aminophilum]|uniref:Polymerase/histidinol phosphatase N-terminal domain-containing protein n=1 Tax=[Clostridium] aminophilum TaxID=1526 RepID=A0A1I6I8B0_9FIRM|nr:PHP domain-containing protein [[Clostridium] aminophilum]SFR62899.1 hypothetical protein SAMN02910262_00009 [[Clostridium] aminophilum]
MDIIGKGQHQYKANLHSHTTISDGNLTPEAMAQAYRERGYSILAITDHEAPMAHPELNREDFLMITGYEAYIRPDPECRYDPLHPEIHINLLAKRPDCETYVGYDPKFCKYLPHEIAEKLPKCGPEGPRLYTLEYIQNFIDCARAAGYLVAMNHPVWSMESEDTLLRLNGLYSLEIYNTGSYTINGSECNNGLYDAFLMNGKMLYCHGADDNHNKKPFDDLLSDSFGSWTMVMAEELTYPAVMEALKKGNFYASTGPEIRCLTAEHGHVHVEMSGVQRAILVRSMKLCQNVYRPDGGEITGADFDLPEDTEYAYLILRDRYGKEAHTRAFTRKELGLE